MNSPDDRLWEDIGYGIGQAINAATDVPLPEKNKRRAAGGAFVLVACAVNAFHGFPVFGWKATATASAMALLYVVVGIHGARGTARFDVMSVFWRGVGLVIVGALLAFFMSKGLPLCWVEIVGFGTLVGGVLGIVLTVWPPPGAKLPHPSKIPGIPDAGAASPKAAHAAINRKKV